MQKKYQWSLCSKNYAGCNFRKTRYPSRYFGHTEYAHNSSLMSFRCHLSVTTCLCFIPLVEVLRCKLKRLLESEKLELFLKMFLAEKKIDSSCYCLIPSAWNRLRWVGTSILSLINHLSCPEFTIARDWNQKNQRSNPL